MGREGISLKEELLVEDERSQDGRRAPVWTDQHVHQENFHSGLFRKHRRPAASMSPGKTRVAQVFRSAVDREANTDDHDERSRPQSC